MKVITEKFKEEMNPEDRVYFEESVKKYRSIGTAAKNKDAKALDLFLTYLYPVKSRTRDDKQELENLLLHTVAESSPEIYETIKKHDVSVNLFDYLQIIDTNSDPNRPKTRNITPVFLAFESGNLDMIKYLFEKKIIDLNVRDVNDETMLMVALANSNRKLADFIYNLPETEEDRKALLNAVTPFYNQTAMHKAAQCGDLDSLHWLIEHKADPSIDSSFNQLASEMLPEEERFEEVFSVLEQYREDFKVGHPFTPPAEWKDPEEKEPTEEDKLKSESTTGPTQSQNNSTKSSPVKTGKLTP